MFKDSNLEIRANHCGDKSFMTPKDSASTPLVYSFCLNSRAPMALEGWFSHKPVFMGASAA